MIKVDMGGDSQKRPGCALNIMNKHNKHKKKLALYVIIDMVKLGALFNVYGRSLQC